MRRLLGLPGVLGHQVFVVPALTSAGLKYVRAVRMHDSDQLQVTTNLDALEVSTLYC
jgi:hypothetical protein